MKQKLWKVYAVIFLVVVCIPEIYGVIDTYSPINFLYAMYTSVFFGLVYIYAFTKIWVNNANLGDFLSRNCYLNTIGEKYP